MYKPRAILVVDYENARKYLRHALQFVNRNLSRVYRIVKRLAFNVNNVHVPGLVTILTSYYYNKKIQGNQLVDREIEKYLMNEFDSEVLILIAGDNHYAKALQEVKRRGAYVIVIAHLIARKLYEIADEYYLVDMDAIPEPVVIPVKQ